MKLDLDDDRAIYLSELERCQPAEALASRHRKHRWMTVPYEADGVKGTMLCAGEETDAPPVSLTPGVKGWYAIYLGLWSSFSASKVKIKLSGSAAYTQVERESRDYQVIDETFWMCADLTDQDVVIAQQTAGQPAPTAIAYVKLIPLTDSQIHELQAEWSDPANRRLIYMNDGFSDFYRYSPVTAEEIREWIEPLRNTDFGVMCWCLGIGGDQVAYPSRYGKVIGADISDFPRSGDRRAKESVQSLIANGIDPLATAIDYAHDLGVDVHISQRMEAFQCCVPFDEFFTGQFFPAHPEWRCVDRDGRPIARMSYAFPGVRDLILDMFREVATNYDIDGVNPIFNRGAPFLLYEQPLIEGFSARTGLDPRALDERDERYLAYRAETMTEFMRTLRQEMDRLGAARGRRLAISAHVLNNEQENRFYGLDLATWVREGLIDNLISYPWRNQALDQPYFAQLTRGTEVNYFPDIMPRRMSPEEYRQRAIESYEAGADGLCFWDTNLRQSFLKEWSMLRRLGHRDEVPAWNDGEGEYFRSIKLFTVGGYTIDVYPPQWAF